LSTTQQHTRQYLKEAKSHTRQEVTLRCCYCSCFRVPPAQRDRKRPETCDTAPAAPPGRCPLRAGECNGSAAIAFRPEFAFLSAPGGSLGLYGPRGAPQAGSGRLGRLRGALWASMGPGEPRRPAPAGSGRLRPALWASACGTPSSASLLLLANLLAHSRLPTSCLSVLLPACLLSVRV
jgi:hypothetical protein